MKLTTQATIVIVAGITGLVLMVWFLATAGWSEGGIAGMVTGIGTAIGALIVVIRNQGNTHDALESQDVRLAKQDQQLAKIVRQTNSLTDDEKQEIAERAATSVVRQFRPGGKV